MKSMTGYGRVRHTIENREITTEIKSVNHRYFDCNVKAPRIYGFLEDAVKKICSKNISRGKVDVYISINEIGASDIKIVLNESLVAQYLNALNKINETYDVRNDISVMQIAKLPDVLSMEKEEEDAESLLKDVSLVLEETLCEYNKMREVEGLKLADDVNNRLDNILSMVETVETRSPVCVAEYRQRLEKRMAEVLADTNIEEQRVLIEAAIFADKTAVDEETVRLKSHIEQLKNMLHENNAIGRKIDFLVQEMNRETNTIGSKANDVTIAGIVVNMKAEIEKIREQIQNIE